MIFQELRTFLANFRFFSMVFFGQAVSKTDAPAIFWRDL
jgi:hypothetical protein